MNGNLDQRIVLLINEHGPVRSLDIMRMIGKVTVKRFNEAMDRIRASAIVKYEGEKGWVRT